jgi:hypothetical protein
MVYVIVFNLIYIVGCIVGSVMIWVLISLSISMLIVLVHALELLLLSLELSVIPFSNRWTYTGSIVVTGTDVFVATSIVEIDGDFHLDVDATLTVSTSGFVYAATVAIDGLVRFHVESQIDLDIVAFTVTAGKRQSGAQKEIVVAAGANATLSNADNFEITFGTKYCATFEPLLKQNETHVVIVLDNYDDTECPDSYNGYTAETQTSSSSESTTDEIQETTGDSVTLVASIFATLAFL